MKDLLLNLVVVFEAHKSTAVTLLQATVVAMQVVVCVKREETSTLKLVAYHHPVRY